MFFAALSAVFGALDPVLLTVLVAGGALPPVTFLGAAELHQHVICLSPASIVLIWEMGSLEDVAMLDASMVANGTGDLLSDIPVSVLDAAGFLFCAFTSGGTGFLRAGKLSPVPFAGLDAEFLGCAVALLATL